MRTTEEKVIWARDWKEGTWKLGSGERTSWNQRWFSLKTKQMWKQRKRLCWGSSYTLRSSMIFYCFTVSWSFTFFFNPLYPCLGYHTEWMKKSPVEESNFDQSRGTGFFNPFSSPHLFNSSTLLNMLLASWWKKKYRYSYVVNIVPVSFPPPHTMVRINSLGSLL